MLNLSRTIYLLILKIQQQKTQKVAIIPYGGIAFSQSNFESTQSSWSVPFSHTLTSHALIGYELDLQSFH